jgi:hypothetical protein
MPPKKVERHGLATNVSRELEQVNLVVENLFFQGHPDGFTGRILQRSSR